MPVKRFRPYTPSRREMTVADFSVVTKTTPEKSLTEPNHKSGDRSNLVRVNMCGPGGAPKRAQRVTRPGKDCQRQRGWNLQPIVPAVQIGEAVGAHDPHEIGALQHRRHAVERLGRSARTDLPFKVGHDKAGMPRDLSREGEARLVFACLTRSLQRILRRHEPPHPVERHFLQRGERHAD